MPRNDPGHFFSHVRSDNEEIVCGNLQVLVHLRELNSGLAAPAIRVVEQDTLPAIVDDVVVRVLRLASDREEAALEPYRMAEAARAAEFGEDGVVEIDRILVAR